MHQEPIIIFKKRRTEPVHHSGAWKVAYADFVTALMSLFIVLWLMNSSKPIQEAVGGYFRDPYGSAKKTGHDIGAGEPVTQSKEDLTQLKNNLLRKLQTMPEFDKLKDQIEITITDEGLRVELLESPKGTFFENGNSDPTAALRDVLSILSVEAGKLPNPISLEGHTDSTPFSDSSSYGNWELSTDRANAARRFMEGAGLRPAQVVQVRGFADRKLRKPQQPQDASNRRISILIQYQSAMEKAVTTAGDKLPAVPAP
jgi:chemotaxis protein MotB